MKNLFLTSSVHAVAHDITTRVDLLKGNKLVFITTAAEKKTGDLSWLKNDRKALISAGFAVTDYTITNKQSQELTADLSHYDYIYLSGGDTFYLLHQSRKSGFVSVINELVANQGKTYIGTSAGSIIAGPQIPEYLVELTDPGDFDLTNRVSYDLVNFTILPHWGRPDFKNRYLQSRLEIAYQENQYPLLLLTVY